MIDVCETHLYGINGKHKVTIARLTPALNEKSALCVCIDGRAVLQLHTIGSMSVFLDKLPAGISVNQLHYSAK